MSEPKGTAAIIISSNGKFLLHLRDNKTTRLPDQWCLIGGGIDKNETSEQASIREIKEEIGQDPVEHKFYVRIESANINGGASDIFIAKIPTEGNDIKVTEGRAVKLFEQKELEEFLSKLNYTNPYLEVLKEYLKVSKHA